MNFLFIVLIKNTMRGDRTRDQSIKSRTLYQTELARLLTRTLGFDPINRNAGIQFFSLFPKHIPGGSEPWC